VGQRLGESLYKRKQTRAAVILKKTLRTLRGLRPRSKTIKIGEKLNLHRATPAIRAAH